MEYDVEDPRFAEVSLFDLVRRRTDFLGSHTRGITQPANQLIQGDFALMKVLRKAPALLGVIQADQVG